MKIYFYIGIIFIVFNVLLIILTRKYKYSEFTNDENDILTSPYGLKLIGIIFSIIIFLLCFVIQFLSSGFFITLLLPVIIVYPLYYYFRFLCNTLDVSNIKKKEFFTTVYLLLSIFYLLFFPLGDDLSLNDQIKLIISFDFPLCEIIIIIYIHFICYAILLNIILLFDGYNYILKKKEISIQKFRKDHSNLSIIAFIISGYISSIILNSQFIEYPFVFDFDRFQNIILIYQIFLGSVSIMKSLNKTTNKQNN